MRILWIYVATFLMIFRGGYEIGKHEHVHHEVSRWEILSDSAVRTSGDPSTGWGYPIQQRRRSSDRLLK